MALFTITYDLIKNKDYDALIGALEGLATVKAELSLWLPSANNNATEVKDHLAQYVDDDDKLMVIEFSKRPQFTKTIKGTNNWLNKFF